MNQSSLYEMKHSIVQVVSDYVELEGEDLVEVNVTMDEAMGTIYSVAMPVTRVKPQVGLCSNTGGGVVAVWVKLLAVIRHDVTSSMQHVGLCHVCLVQNADRGVNPFTRWLRLSNCRWAWSLHSPRPG